VGKQYSVFSEAIPQEIRAAVAAAITALPGRGGTSAADYRSKALAAIQAVAAAWGGRCASPSYNGHKEPLHFTCAAGHTFPLLIHILRRGGWCPACAYDRVVKYTIEDMRLAAAKNGGLCLSEKYVAAHLSLRWRCAKSHEWSARPDGVMRGNWCMECSYVARKPTRQQIDARAAAHGGQCLSEYVDKQTPLKWQCAKLHTWNAPWFRVNRGRWCHQCACVAKSFTIEMMQELAASRGGSCLSKEYRGAHGKLEWLCYGGHAWWATANSIRHGSWCPHCRRKDGLEGSIRRRPRPVPKCGMPPIGSPVETSSGQTATANSQNTLHPLSK
jgi:hypothetical protein